MQRGLPSPAECYIHLGYDYDIGRMAGSGSEVPSPASLRQLIVTADDVGLDRGMTAGAIEAHRHGIVTACSIVANGRAFDDAVARLRDVPSLEVGVHLTLVEEQALTTGRPMPRNYLRFLLSP